MKTHSDNVEADDNIVLDTQRYDLMGLPAKTVYNAAMAKLILFNKPFDVLCQFTDQSGRSTLADYLNDAKCKDVYPAGRLDRDSEGLVLLTNNGQLQHQISHPSKKEKKTYWVQVEGDITDNAISQLRQGVELNDGLTRPADVDRIEESLLWERSKPIRYRKNQSTSWICLRLTEGKNRQVRRMTASVGFPTLRLIRYAIGEWSLSNVNPGKHDMLQPGEYVIKTVNAPKPSTRKDNDDGPSFKIKKDKKFKKPDKLKKKKSDKEKKCR